MFSRNEKDLIDSLINIVSGELGKDKDSKEVPCEDGIYDKDVPTSINGGDDIDGIINNAYNIAERTKYIHALSDKCGKESPDSFNDFLVYLNDKLKDAKDNGKIIGYILRRNFENDSPTACYVKIYYNIVTAVDFRLSCNTGEKDGSVCDEIKNVLSIIFRYGNIYERPSNLAVDKLKSLVDSMKYSKASMVSTIKDVMTAAYVKRDIDKGSLVNYRCGMDSVVYLLKFAKNGKEWTIELNIPCSYDEIPGVVSFDVVEHVAEKFGGFETPETELSDKNGVTGKTFKDCCGLETDRNDISEMEHTSGFVRLEDDYPVDTCGGVVTTASTVINDAADSETEMVNHPAHYNQYPIETIDMMAKIWGNKATALWCEMTAFKYRMRMGVKPGNETVQDIEKERWYLNKAKELSPRD